MKKETGITLIALVLTIIVLLILAYVTLRVVAGEQGILRRAEDVTVKQNTAIAIEELELLVGELKIKYWEEESREDIQQYIIQNLQVYDGKLDGTLRCQRMEI